MTFTNFAVFFTFSFFIFSDCAFVDNLPKCHLDDNECMRDLYETVIRDIGKHGIPDLNIPPVDPIHLKNVTVSVLNMFNITLVEGVAKGIKDCIFKSFSIKINEEIGHQENNCDLVIKGHYIFVGDSPLIQTFLGESAVHGDGNGKVEIEKLNLKFDFPFYAQKREDGEIYIKCLYDLVKYEYDIEGAVRFFADNLYLGNEEVSQPITELLNANARFIMSAFGQPFVDKAMEFYFTFAGYFFDNIPARHFIIEDLSPYAKP